MKLLYDAIFQKNSPFWNAAREEQGLHKSIDIYPKLKIMERLN